jgi:hypothetical protein
MKHVRRVGPPDPTNEDQILENGLFLLNHHYAMAEEVYPLKDVLKECVENRWSA